MKKSWLFAVSIASVAAVSASAAQLSRSSAARGSLASSPVDLVAQIFSGPIREQKAPSPNGPLQEVSSSDESQDAPVLLASAASRQNMGRPRYDLDLKLDWKLLSFKASGDFSVPVARGDSVREAVFFVFANAGGVGGADASHPHIAVDDVSFNGAPVPWKLDGAVLRVSLPQAQTEAFSLQMDWHGVVPRLPPSDALGDLMGGAGADLDSLMAGALGGAAGATGAAAGNKPKPAVAENTDFGLYGYANGVLSLGAFWYPTLAVRTNGRWVDEAPRGLGDVSYADQSDYNVSLQLPPQVLVAAPGRESTSNGVRVWQLRGARDFAILASDAFVRSSKAFDVGGKSVRVEAFTTRAHAAKSSEAIEVAGRALQVYARRFGPYPRDRFAVVEGPLRGGAGGMEYSGMTAIAGALYGDLQAQLGALTDMAGLSGGSIGDNALGGLLGDLEKEAYGEGGGTNGGTTSTSPGAAGAKGDDLGALAGLGPAGDLLKQQGAILGSMFEATIAHEAAHQWWAIGVGSDSQRAPWIDESLTTWSAMLYFEDRYGKARSEQMMDAHLKGAYSVARMLGAPDGQADRRTSDFSNNLQYGALVYGKGALFYDRLRDLMGDAAFFGALRSYYALNNGRLSSPQALQRAFVEAAPEKNAQIGALFGRWFREAHGDEDITGGTPASLSDLLGQAMGGGMMGGEQE